MSSTGSRANSRDCRCLCASSVTGGAFDQVRKHAFAVPEIAALYHFPSAQDGGERMIALIELGGGYWDADLDNYCARLHLHRPEVTTVSVDRGRNPNSVDGQVMLDIEVTGAVAPAANLVVHFAPKTNAGFRTRSRLQSTMKPINPR